MINISPKIKEEVLSRDKNACQKCGFNKDLEIHHINPRVSGGKEDTLNLITLCSICHKHAPDNQKEFLEFISEKIDGKILNSFRKSNYSISKKTRLGMEASFRKGLHLTKAPKGYKLVNKKLTVSESDAECVKEIFKEFLNTNISLTQLSKKYGLTTSGIKKLLMNTTYRGKVKFANEESQGEHIAIIGEELFNKVQEKFGQYTKP